MLLFYGMRIMCIDAKYILWIWLLFAFCSFVYVVLEVDVFRCIVHCFLQYRTLFYNEENNV